MIGIAAMPRHVASCLVVAFLIEGQAAHAAELAGTCRPDASGPCRCSLSSLETSLLFSEAAGAIEIYYREFPDESYETVLISMLRQCVQPLPKPDTGRDPAVLVQGAHARTR